MITFTVWEKRNDNKPHYFGKEHFELTPSVGDRVLLHWVDDSPAYEVNITKVNIEDKILIVKNEL